MSSGLGERIRLRIRGFPVTPRELNLSLRLLGVMREMGWHRSIRGRVPVDRRGQALPWLTYPAILWLDAVLSRDLRVFEYGAGNSTLWLAARVNSVVSVEHAGDWVATLKPQLPAHCLLLERTPAPAGDGTDDPYVDAIREVAAGLDVVIIDGVARNECVRTALAVVAEDGLVVLDDAERLAYGVSLDALADAGFRRIDLVGPSPGQAYLKTTALFSRRIERWLPG